MMIIWVQKRNVIETKVLQSLIPHTTSPKTFISHLFPLIFPVVNQYFEAQVYDVFVIRGNSAIFKCQIPSFVTDHVEIVSWQDTEGGVYNATSSGDLHTGTKPIHTSLSSCPDNPPLINILNKSPL